MSQTLQQVAEQLNNTKKVQLIYAFNGTGKTRLSKEFKSLIAPPHDDEDRESSDNTRDKMLYYNAFTEDLFYWDNDLHGDAEPKLKIQPNSFTTWVLEEQGQDQNIISNFQRYTSDKLTPKFNASFDTVTFSIQTGDENGSDNIKISKGEESNFIWSVFYTLLEQVIGVLNVAEKTERETNDFDELEYVFIDDPVSSLDENHLIQLAVHLASLIKSSKSKVKFVITTHNPLFYNVLYNELKNKTCYLLQRTEDGMFTLDTTHGDSNKSFSYHLHIMHLMEQAINDNAVQRYHFILLRNLYEKTASFLGYAKWSDLLPDNQKAYETRVMNFYSHQSLSNETMAEPTTPEKQTVNFLLKHLKDNYAFWQEEASQ